MSNFTFQIQNCKIIEYNSKQSKGWGKLHWTDGTCDFELKFQTTYQNVIDVIEANRNAEASFKVSGSQTINIGYGDHKGKTFQNYVVTDIELIGGIEKKEWVNPVVVEDEIDDIPF